MFLEEKTILFDNTWLTFLLFCNRNETMFSYRKVNARIKLIKIVMETSWTDLVDEKTVVHLSVELVNLITLIMRKLLRSKNAQCKGVLRLRKTATYA